MKNQRIVLLKNILLYFLIFAFTLEVSPFLLGSFFLENGYSRKKINAELEQRAGIQTDSIDPDHTKPEGYLSEHMVHPYLGFVHKPVGSYNEYGFPFAKPLAIRSEDTLNVCVTGGSVAKQLVQFSSSTLTEQLKKIPGFAGKEINLVVLALGGFKQPQQMLALSYYMSLGAFYDVVINLDGFNEVVLPYADNLPFGIHSSYPRHWNVYSRKMLDNNSIVILGKQTVLKEKQYNRARNVKKSLLRNSNAALFIWKILDQETDLTIHKIENELRTALSESDLSPQTTGPAEVVSDTLKYLQQQVEVWANCSRFMDDLSNDQEFQYYHFLQPNQYFEGSKVLTDEELKIAFEQGEFPYKTAVRLAFPMLIREGQNLVSEGIQFRDLTLLFKNTTHSVYSDKCCHFNKTGYDAIVTEIVKTISLSQ